MNEELQLKLQAFLDEELSSEDAHAVRELLTRDRAAQDLLVELTHTRDAVVAHADAIKLPEAREFYWSKIERQIRRENVMERADVPRFSFNAWLQRALVPAGALAVVAIAVMLSLPQSSGAGDYTTTSGDTSLFTYHNYDTGSTLVWLDYSALENDFSDFESDDTLDL